MAPYTVKDLIQWLQLNCYNKNYQILEESNLDGQGLGQLGSKYYWFRRERGNITSIQYFESETEAASQAFAIISKDKYARRHLLRIEPNQWVTQHLVAELSQRGLEYSVDEVQSNTNFGLPAYAIYVYGCDLKKALDLKYKAY